MINFHYFLDTHKLLNKNIIDVSSRSLRLGEVNVLCDIDEQEVVVTGCLAVLIASNDKRHLPVYRMIQNGNNQTTTHAFNLTTSTGLASNGLGMYRVMLFELLGYPPTPVQFPAVFQNFNLSQNDSIHLSLKQGIPIVFISSYIQI